MSSGMVLVKLLSHGHPLTDVARSISSSQSLPARRTASMAPRELPVPPIGRAVGV